MQVPGRISILLWLWIFENLLWDIVWNVEVCEIVLIASDSTEYEFSAATFIFKVLLLSWQTCVYRQAGGW